MTKWANPNSLGTLEILISLSVCLLVDFQIITLPFDKCGQRHIPVLNCCTSSFAIVIAKKTIRAGLDESVGKKILQLSVS